MVTIDAQTVRGGRAGPTFHSAGGRGGRTIGTKRSIPIEILELAPRRPGGSAKPHDLRVGRELLADNLVDLPDVRAIVADRGYRGLARLAARKQPFARHQDIAQGDKASAKAWLEVVCVAYLFVRLRAEPT